MKSFLLKRRQAGNDLLIGGAGRDIYVVGERKDRIRDAADGQGVVRSCEGYVFGGGNARNGWGSRYGCPHPLDRATRMAVAVALHTDRR